MYLYAMYYLNFSHLNLWKKIGYVTRTTFPFFGCHLTEELNP
jgi:hypothetical protein